MLEVDPPVAFDTVYPPPVLETQAKRQPRPNCHSSVTGGAAQQGMLGVSGHHGDSQKLPLAFTAERSKCRAKRWKDLMKLGMDIQR